MRAEPEGNKITNSLFSMDYDNKNVEEGGQYVILTHIPHIKILSPSPDT